ncbi:MAG: hypothetical protein ACO1RX_01560 [Candidatus Sericytochromatia bacterium]
MSDEYMMAALALQTQQDTQPPTGPDEPADEQQTEHDIQTVLQNFPSPAQIRAAFAKQPKQYVMQKSGRSA